MVVIKRWNDTYHAAVGQLAVSGYACWKDFYDEVVRQAEREQDVAAGKAELLEQDADDGDVAAIA